MDYLLAIDDLFLDPHPAIPLRTDAHDVPDDRVVFWIGGGKVLWKVLVDTAEDLYRGQ